MGIFSMSAIESGMAQKSAIELALRCLGLDREADR